MSINVQGGRAPQSPEVAFRRRVQPPTKKVSKDDSALRGSFTSNPFKGVDWSPAFICFCLYIFAITSYRVPIGTPAMVLALVTLPLEKRPIRMPLLAVLVIAYIGWCLVGFMTTRFAELVADHVNEFAKVTAVVFVACNVITSRSRFRFFTTAWTVTFCLFPLRGTLVNYFIGHETLAGRAIWNFIYNNPNDLAGLTILALAIALGVAAVERRWWVKLGASVGAGLMVLVIFLTQSRGAFIALIGFLVFGARRYLLDVRRLAFLVLLGGVVLFLAPDSMWKRFASISTVGAVDESMLVDEEVDLAARGDASSSLQRIAIWEVALSVIGSDPITGVGLGGYPEAHYDIWRHGTGQFSYLARGKRDTHSTYLNIIAETGFVGFALFATMVSITMLKVHRARITYQKRHPALGMQLFNLEIGMYGFLIAGIWGSYGEMIPLYLTLVLLNAGSELIADEDKPAEGTMRRGARPVAQPGVNRRMGAVA